MAAGNGMQVGEDTYALLQVHFHTPSEHAFDDGRTAMEAHLVHRNIATGGLAVVGVLLRASWAENPFLGAALELAPGYGGSPFKVDAAIFDPNELLPNGLHLGGQTLVHYGGSLTTPPCSEGVEWMVCTETGVCSPEQVEAFRKYLKYGIGIDRNSRPLQPDTEWEDVWTGPLGF